ncbi:MAG: GDSL-type esterase/lipase family protein [Acidobacteria bacterium]|nr:GDSL-type esterase/lipase family protein [Acidobacteriota bacterium]
MRTDHAIHRYGGSAVSAVGLAMAVACSAHAHPRISPTAVSAIRIVFVGDSLVHRSAADHAMLDAVRAGLTERHPSLTFELIDAGVNGNGIADIQARLDEDVLALHPAAVVLYWDSDVSDVDESHMSEAQVATLRAAYKRRLHAVLTTLVASGAHVIVSGPTLIGELPRGRNPKDRQLDAYRWMNRAMAASLKVVYIDTRRAFFARRPRQAPVDADHGLLTEDGEHLNDDGAAVVRDQFVNALDAWLRTLPGGEPRGPGALSRPSRRPEP